MSDQTLAMPEPFLTNLLAGSGWKVVEATERLRVWAHPKVGGEEILQGINVSEPEGRRLTRNALAALERTTGLARPMRPGKVKPRDKKLIQLVRQRLYGPVAPQLPAGVAAAEKDTVAAFLRAGEPLIRDSERERLVALLHAHAEMFDGYMPWRHAAYQLAANLLAGRPDTGFDQWLTDFENEIRADERNRSATQTPKATHD